MCFSVFNRIQNFFHIGKETLVVQVLEWTIEPLQQAASQNFEPLVSCVSSRNQKQVVKEEEP